MDGFSVIGGPWSLKEFTIVWLVEAIMFFVFESTDDRDLIFRNGPYFMAPQGLYLNKCTHEFDPT